MPRTLPWLNQTSTSTNQTTASATISAHQKRRKLTAKDAGEDGPHTSASRSCSLKRMDTFAPPSVESMLPSDECYIMVEDELHDIAHQFTRSLHRAEYQRLQALAASKNASSISEIQRPTNGPGGLPKEHLIRLGRIARANEQDRPLRDLPRVKDENGSISDDEEKATMSQWEGTNLGALMLSPGQRKKDLSTKWKMKATTRAAAGFHRGKSDLANKKQSVQAAKGDNDIDESNVSRRLFCAGRASEGSNAPKIPEHAKPKCSVHSRKEVKKEHSGTDDEDEDDDLDAPIIKTVHKNLVSRHPHRDIAVDSRTQLKRETSTSPKPRSRPSSVVPPLRKPPPTSSAPIKRQAKHASSAPLDLSVFDDFLSLPAPKSTILGPGIYKGKAMAALAKKREMEKMK